MAGAAVVVFCASFLAYFSVVFVGVPGGDAGELLAEACNFGVAHPPGYPLLTMLSGAIFRTLGQEWPPALIGNTMAAVFSACTAALLYACCCKILIMDVETAFKGATGPPIRLGMFPFCVSALAVAFFAFSPLVFLYAVSAEVFAFNNFLCALVMWTFIKYLERRTIYQKSAVAWACAGSLASGTSCCGLRSICSMLGVSSTTYCVCVLQDWRCATNIQAFY